MDGFSYQAYFKTCMYTGLATSASNEYYIHAEWFDEIYNKQRSCDVGSCYVPAFSASLSPRTVHLHPYLNETIPSKSRLSARVPVAPTTNNNIHA